MQTISFIVYILAAICLYAGLHHLIFFIRRPKDKTNLLFALMCLTHFSYFIVQGFWYSSTTVDQAFPLVQSAYGIISAVMILQLWFFYMYCEKSFRIFWCYLGTAVFSIFAVLSFIPGDLTLSIHGAVLKNATFLDLINISIREFQPGPLFQLMLLCTFVEMIFILVIVYKYYFKRFGSILMPMPLAWAIVVMAATHDALAASGVINTIYLSEFAYTLLIISMAYRLTNDFIDAMDEVERLNISLDTIVTERTYELEEKNQELEILSITDQLTGIFNRRHGEDVLQKSLLHCERYGSPLSLMIIDLDHFKSVNDTYGHDKGDQVLINVANIIRDSIRNTDEAVRWGGEEFLVIAPNTEIEVCSTLANRLRKQIGSIPQDSCGQITASFGVAVYHRGDTINSLIKRADMGLYKAKRQGRNRIVAG